MKTPSIHSIQHLLAGALALAALMTSSGFAAGTTVAANISRLVDPIYPIRLLAIGVSEGSATIMVDLDDTGKMIDWIPLSATNEEYVAAISRVINDWKFTPAYRDGEPIPYALYVTVKFKSDSIMMSFNGVQMVQAYLSGLMDTTEKPLVSKYSELDAMPTPINVVQPVLSSDISPDQRAGEVVLGFFIDATGHVRMPVLLKCDGDIRLAYAAYNALLMWQFEKPTVRGQATMVSARQKFIFTAKSETAK